MSWLDKRPHAMRTDAPNQSRRRDANEENRMSSSAPLRYGHSQARSLVPQRDGHRSHLLAVLQPDGTACDTREVTMWERSQVEQLTGLSRHMILDLCYQNTKHGGLGFWKPAVSKPGYSRFDEGDLLMFYLVGQLKRAGFTLKEVEPAVFDLLEEDGALEQALHEKERVLAARQAALEEQLSALACLEDAAMALPADRLYAVMAISLRRSMDHSIEQAVSETQVSSWAVDRARAAGGIFVDWLLASLGAARDAAGAANCAAAQRLGDLADALARLLEAKASPADPVAQQFVAELVEALLDESDEAGAAGSAARDDDVERAGAASVSDAGQAAGSRLHGVVQDAAGQVAGSRLRDFVQDAADQAAGSGQSDSTLVAAADANSDAARASYLLMSALGCFLHDAQNGVPVELVCGKGSFAFLASATAHAAATGREKERFE